MLFRIGNETRVMRNIHNLAYASVILYIILKMDNCTKAQLAIGKEPISVPKYDSAMATSHCIDDKIIIYLN